MDPVDEAKDMFWSLSMWNTCYSCLTFLLARKAKSAGKSAFKNLKKAVGIPTGPLSEANPRYYMAISAQGALVRKELELTSPEVYNLRFGEVVTVAEIVGRRARIIDPVEGWVSLVTSSNESIFELTFPPDKRTQVRTMERRFEKMKQEQAMRAGESSPVATPMIHRTDDVVDPESIKDGLVNLKSKIVFKSKLEGPTPVPALGPILRAPGLKPPAASGNTDLLDFASSPNAAQGSSGIATPEVLSEQESFSLI
jgi:hypothetical protein